MHLEKKWLFVLAVLAALGASAADAAAQEPTFITSNTLFAVVESNGALVRGNGINFSVRNGLGSYTVQFLQTTAGCAIQASGGFTGSTGAPPPTEVTVRRTTNKRNVLVNTQNAGGVLVDSAFHLVLNCAKGAA
jgi:hypothetical protein